MNTVPIEPAYVLILHPDNAKLLMEAKMTNKEFSVKDEFFGKCCSQAGIPATIRQASKFRRKMGLAYKARGRVLKEVAK